MDRTTWDKAVATYRGARLLSDAVESFGPHHEICSEYERAGHSNPALREAMLRSELAVSENIYKPLWAAANALVLCPAPDLDALTYKLAVIKDEEVWNDSDFRGDCWQVFAEEVERLTGVGCGELPEMPIDAALKVAA